MSIRLRGAEPWWSVTNESSALACAQDVADQLKAIAIPKLAELLDRRRLIGFLRSQGRDGFAALLLADEGPSDDLDDTLKVLEAARDQETRWERARNIDELVSWARNRAGEVG